MAVCGHLTRAGARCSNPVSATTVTCAAGHPVVAASTAFASGQLAVADVAVTDPFGRHAPSTAPAELHDYATAARWQRTIMGRIDGLSDDEANWFVGQGLADGNVRRTLQIVQANGGPAAYPLRGDIPPERCQAVDWAMHGFDPDTARAWHDTGGFRPPTRTPAQAQNWAMGGWDPESAGAWVRAGITDPTAASVAANAGLTPEDARADRLWAACGEPSGPWKNMFASSRDAVMWRSLMGSDTAAWRVAGWREDEAAAARDWTSYGYDDADVALQWHRAGDGLWTAQQGDRLARHGWTPMAAMLRARAYSDPVERRCFLDSPPVMVP